MAEQILRPYFAGQRFVGSGVVVRVVESRPRKAVYRRPQLSIFRLVYARLERNDAERTGLDSAVEGLTRFRRDNLQVVRFLSTTPDPRAAHSHKCVR